MHRALAYTLIWICVCALAPLNAGPDPALSARWFFDSGKRVRLWGVGLTVNYAAGKGVGLGFTRFAKKYPVANLGLVDTPAEIGVGKWSQQYGSCSQFN